MNANGFVVTSAFLGSGLLVGHAARRLLARLRRGAVFRPPGCELFTAMASAIVGWRFAIGALPAWWCAVPLLLGWLAVPLAAVDLSVYRLPNALTYAAYPILGTALTVAAIDGPDHGLALRALVGTAVFGGAHEVLRWFASASLGAGDVKLAGSLGAVLGSLGWQSLPVATALAAIITLLLALTHFITPTALAPPKEHPRTPEHQPSAPALARRKEAAPRREPLLVQSLTRPVEAPATLEPTSLARQPASPTNLKEAPTTPSGESPPPDLTLTPARVPLLRRAVPHGPGLLAATWLLATFPGQALIGGVTG